MVQGYGKSWRLPGRLIVAGVVALLAVGYLGVEAPAASAHAYFLGSNPAPGKRVERSPSAVTIEFTEPVNHSLSKATIVNVSTGKPIATEPATSSSKEIVVKPVAALPRAPYRVDWFSVSTDDGHALAGQFSFGVRTAAVGGANSTEEGPLSNGGWWRIALRAVFYVALFFFAGGVLNSALLAGRAGRGAWLVPSGPLKSALAATGKDPDLVTTQVWQRTVEAGWLAAAAAATLAIADAANAAGGLSPHGLNDYLLTNTAGIARVLTVVLLTVAAVAARRLARIAAACCVVAFLAIAFSGHANSAHPHALALLTDWIHLVAGAVWIGGIAQLAVTWTGSLIRGHAELRGVVMGAVLDRFGRVALPAFLVVLTTGLANLLIELGSPAELWQSSYGRVLAVKIGLVAGVATISYLHALRLRPRLAAANPHPEPRIERRHWSLLRREPLVGAAVLAAAALLVAFPLPPRQSASAAQGQSLAAACNPYCPLPTAKDDELPVAEHLGPAIVGAWLRYDGGGLSGEVRLLGDNLKPLPGPPTVGGAEVQGCGSGCWSFHLPDRPASIAVSAPIDGHTYATRLPARWIPGGRANQRARELLAKLQETMNGLESVSEYEWITSGPGSLAVTTYHLSAPDRLAYQTQLGAESVIIAGRQWNRDPSQKGWELSKYGGGGPPFITRTWFRWTPYAQAVRLLGFTHHGTQRIAEIALYDQASATWWRLRIDLGSMRAEKSRLITQAHFMTQRYYGFNQPLSISPPPRSHGG